MVNETTQGIPARVFELLGAAAGVPVSAKLAGEAAAIAGLGADDWTLALARAARHAALSVASFGVEGIDELERLRSLDMPAAARVGDRWLVLTGVRGPALDLTILDELGEQRLGMRPSALLDWLVAHTSAALPMCWLVVEPRQLLAPIAGPRPPMDRLLALARLERSDLGVVVVHALAIGAGTLAVPIAAQALVNTVATSAMLQPLVVLGALLLAALGFVAVLRVSQAIVVEQIQQRLFARVAIDFARRLPRLAPSIRRDFSGPELANRFFEVVNLQKTAAALLIDGSALVLQIAVGLLLLGFYHPWLLVFDLALIVGVVVVLLAGRGAMTTSMIESHEKYAVAAWLENLAGAPLRFADSRSRRQADARAELLLRAWLEARRNHFRHLLRQFVGGVGLQVVASAGLLAIGGWLVIERQLTLGQLVAAELVVALIGAGLGKLGKHLENLYDAATAAAKLGKLLDLPLESTNGDPLGHADSPMAVELRERSTDALVLALAPGQRLGLIGCTPDHARLLDLLHGRARSATLAGRLDDHELDAIELDSLREQVAVVRGTELVIGSVLDNLDGRTIAGEGEPLGPLLERVGLRERLFGLAEGLATTLLPEGSPLDRSEARRLALVRAVLMRPRLLLIDSELDALGLAGGPRTALLDWLFDRARPWTLIVASEDPDLLARCDRRIELSP